MSPIACPFSRHAYIFSNIGAKALLDTLGFIPMFAVGLWFTRSTLTLMAIPAEWLVLLIQFVGLGLLAKLAVGRLGRSACEERRHYA